MATSLVLDATPKIVLVTGATGKQGGSVIDALLAQAPEHTILAVTRDSTSTRARNLALRSPVIKIVQGDLDDVPKLFEDAKELVAPERIWGVFSVQVSQGKGVTPESEVRQGKAMIDASINYGIKHFVYSSVDRGGNKKSWNSPTSVQHFQTKHDIERHLQKMALPMTAGAGMAWTILRPVAFMDNLTPGIATGVFLTAMHDTMHDKPMQWIAVADIGRFAAKAFAQPYNFDRCAISLAGDQLTYQELAQTFHEVTGKPMRKTFSFLGAALKHGVPEMGRMIDWFASDGYGATVAEARKMNPSMMDMRTWLESKSEWRRS